MSKAIRIRHYSYRTEKTYIYWTRNFLGYLTDTKKNNFDIASVDSEDVRDYLSYLALKRKVLASTQNQVIRDITKASQSPLDSLYKHNNKL